MKYMGSYKTKTTITDFGPYITELILDTGCDISTDDICAKDFQVYVERRNAHSGELLKAKEFFQWEEEPQPVKGIRKVVDVYPCDSEGNYCNPGHCIALKMEISILGKIIEGNAFSENNYVVTYRKKAGIFKEGYVFQDYSGDLCPQLKGWKTGQSHSGEIQLNYGYYTPHYVRTSEKEVKALPMIIWLHGAGEGGHQTEIAYIGNKAVNFSSEKIQKYFGGQAWVFVPQCPTVWMDDGKEKLGKSNISIYTSSLKACIDEFITEHKDRIDLTRIYLGGCSNGGFMTVRMAIDYPEFFAAIFPVCAAFYQWNLTSDAIRCLADIPCWIVHCKGDTLVDPEITSVPLYKKLINAGARNVHFTFFDNMDAEAAMFWKNEQFQPHLFDHGVWIKVYNDECQLDFDGSAVICNGKKATLLEWLGCQQRNG